MERIREGRLYFAVPDAQCAAFNISRESDFSAARAKQRGEIGVFVASGEGNSGVQCLARRRLPR
eukprot:4224998-Pleurochrysis_carterae.AAC.1